MIINFYIWWLKSLATMTTEIPQAAHINGVFWLNEEWFDSMDIDTQIKIAKHEFYHWCLGTPRGFV